MPSRDNLAKLRIIGENDLSGRLIEVFATLKTEDGIRQPDIVTRLKEQMEAALRPPIDAPD